MAPGVMSTPVPEVKHGSSGTAASWNQEAPNQLSPSSCLRGKTEELERLLNQVCRKQEEQEKVSLTTVPLWTLSEFCLDNGI